MTAHTFGAEREPMDNDEPEGRWRVFTDGMPNGTRVIAPNGKEVKGIVSLNYHIEADGPGHLSLQVQAGAGLTLAGGSTETDFTCMACSETHTHRCRPPL